MVEQAILDNVFKSLADQTRRDILARLYDQQQTISELAAKYRISFAATAKHISVLERAKLVTKRKQGKQQIVAIAGESLELANQYLQDYERLWNESFDRLEKELRKGEE